MLFFLMLFSFIFFLFFFFFIFFFSFSKLKNSKVHVNALHFRCFYEHEVSAMYSHIITKVSNI